VLDFVRYNITLRLKRQGKSELNFGCLILKFVSQPLTPVSITSGVCCLCSDPYNYEPLNFFRGATSMVCCSFAVFEILAWRRVFPDEGTAILDWCACP
jgi:hypothetical protein